MQCTRQLTWQLCVREVFGGVHARKWASVCWLVSSPFAFAPGRTSSSSVCSSLCMCAPIGASLLSLNMHPVVKQLVSQCGINEKKETYRRKRSAFDRWPFLLVRVRIHIVIIRPSATDHARPRVVFETSIPAHLCPYFWRKLVILVPIYLMLSHVSSVIMRKVKGRPT
jgi:hypothetical protein